MAASIPTGARPWAKHGLCVGLDPAPWYPSRGRGRSNIGHQAKAICAACPVAKQCLTFAVSTNETHGIWGGCGEPKRRALRRLWLNDRDCDGYGWAWSDIDCKCSWCQALEDAIYDRRVLNANGPQATCGVKETYNRGCRCDYCTFAKGAA